LAKHGRHEDQQDHEDLGDHEDYEDQENHEVHRESFPTPNSGAAAKSRTRVVWIAIAAAGVVALIAALLISTWPKENLATVTIGGVGYTSNMEVEEFNGYVYVFIPVNTEVDDAVVEVDDADDSRKIRDFLDSLGTLVPGEHVLELSNSNLHFIVDGIEE
jgi:hypothetical protein